jgi:hypothetical protein
LNIPLLPEFLSGTDFEGLMSYASARISWPARHPKYLLCGNQRLPAAVAHVEPPQFKTIKFHFQFGECTETRNLDMASKTRRYHPMALPIAPDWLAKRDGVITPGIREQIVFIALSGRPQYKLEARPARGKIACIVTQTINGKLIDDATAEYTTQDAAFTGGLERLKSKLGW